MQRNGSMATGTKTNADLQMLESSTEPMLIEPDALLNLHSARANPVTSEPSEPVTVSVHRPC